MRSGLDQWFCMVTDPDRISDRAYRSRSILLFGAQLPFCCNFIEIAQDAAAQLRIVAQLKKQFIQLVCRCRGVFVKLEALVFKLIPTEKFAARRGICFTLRSFGKETNHGVAVVPGWRVLQQFPGPVSDCAQ